MNQLHIIGNLVRDPETRTTQDGRTVCNFTVAVNRRQKGQDGQAQADFFRVSAWNRLAENCQKYLEKGRKVAVSGPVSQRLYQGNDGATKANMEVLAMEVEFLAGKQEGGEAAPAVNTTPLQDNPDDLPF